MSETPWRDKEVMERLYKECDTQKEMAERLGTSEYTISVWLRKHGITSHQPKNGVYFREHKGDNHFQLNIRDETVIPSHAVVAIGTGADPHKVFSDDTHIHHKNCCSLDNRSDNLLVVGEETHQQMHNDEEWAKNVGYISKN